MSAPEQPTDPTPGAPEGLVSAVTVRPTSEIRTDAVRGSWWTAVQAVVSLPLAVVANLVVARTLGPHGFGVLASYLTAYVLIIGLLNAGISDASIQYGAAAYARGDRVEFLAIARRCAGFHILFEGPLGAAAVFILLRREALWVQAVAAACVATTVVIGTASVVLTAMAKNAPLAKLNLIVGVALQTSIMAAALAFRAPGPTWVARLLIGVAIPVGALAIADPLVRRATLTPVLPRGWPAGFAPYATKTLVAGLVATLIFSRTEILILDLQGAAVAAGLFALAAGLATQVTSPIDAMLGPLIPSAAGLLAVDRQRAAAALVRGLRLSGFATACLAVIVVPVVAMAAPLIYGPKYDLVGTLFVALGLTSCLQSVLHPVTAFVTALRVPVTVLGINAVGLVVDLLLLLTFVGRFGATAAVLGNCSGQLVSLAGSVMLIRTKMGIPVRASVRALAPFLAVSALVAVVVAACLEWHRHSGGLAVSAAVAVAGSVAAVVVVYRFTPEALTESDLGPVMRSFPKVERPLSRVLVAMGVYRSTFESNAASSGEPLPPFRVPM